MAISKYFRGAIKILAGLIVFGILGFSALLGLLWLDHTRETVLPAPTGQFPVGRTTCVWTEPTQPELMAPKPGTPREIFAWIWYPAAPTNPAGAGATPQTTAPYLPDPWRIAVVHQRGVLITRFLTRDLSRIRTHSFADAPLSPNQRTYPVVLMRAGLAGLVTGEASLAEDLASHGYVVVGFDAPYRSSIVVFPDGRTIERAPQNNADLLSGADQEQLALRLVQAWSADTSFAVDKLQQLNTSDRSSRFFGRLDLQRLGVFGYSLGGATALQFCHDDARCKVSIDVDGAPLGVVIGEGLSQPVLFLTEFINEASDEEGRDIEKNIRSIDDRSPAGQRSQIMIRGANHFGFSDDGAFLKSPLLMRALRIIGIVALDGRRQIAVTRHYLSIFFDVFLKGAPIATLNDQRDYPEVEYVH